MNMTRTFLGYWHSGLSPETNNDLENKVQAIKKSCNGKIFECTSDKDFNIDDVESMVKEAITKKCNDFVLLVEDSVDSKKLEEAIKLEYKKQFNNVHVIKENFKRVKLTENIITLSTSDIEYVFNKINGAISCLEILKCDIIYDKVEDKNLKIKSFNFKEGLTLEFEDGTIMDFDTFKEKVLANNYLIKEDV